MRKVCFIDSVHPILQQRLEAAGYICDLAFEKSREEILASAQEYVGLIIRSRIAIDAQTIDAFSQLKFIGRSGSGLENIDVDYARKKGVSVFNSPEGNCDAVGEHALGMLLMLMNHLKIADSEVRNGQWRRKENEGHEIKGKTVGIIGFGIMGSSFAKKIGALECRILAYDKYKSNYTPAGVEEVDLETLYAESDIVSLHLPLTAETYHYADDLFFQQFRKPIYFINTGRGAHVNTNALLSAMDKVCVFGACLDVLEFEKSSLEKLDLTEESRKTFHSLSLRNNVVLSPHIAGWTKESYYKLSEVLAEKILAEYPGEF